MTMRRWTDFVAGTVPSDSFAFDPTRDRVWINNLYQVIERFEGEAELDGKTVTHVSLSIKHRTKEAIHDWRDFQRIKNEIIGPEAEAVELYPAESRLVDNANQYWLWCFVGMPFPYGMPHRLVSEGSYRGSKQRPFFDGERPDDCLTAAEANALIEDTRQRLSS